MISEKLKQKAKIYLEEFRKKVAELQQNFFGKCEEVTENAKEELNETLEEDIEARQMVAEKQKAELERLTRNFALELSRESNELNRKIESLSKSTENEKLDEIDNLLQSI